MVSILLKKLINLKTKFGEVKKMIIFALPNKKGVKKVLKKVKKGETKRVIEGS